MTAYRLRLPVLVLTATVALAACSSSGGSGSDGGGSSSGGSITVYAAASLTGAFNQIGEDFKKANPGTDITFQFGSSGALATQITQGADADVFASAATKNMQQVIDGGEARASTNFVSNVAEIAVAPGNPKKITTLADLAKPGTRVALCVPTAPCGALARSIFDKAGVTVTPTANEADVKHTLAIVETGEVDASVVYVTDVKAAGGDVDGVEIPAAQNESTEYPIATLSGSKHAALAEAFVQYVESAAGQKVLADAGFSAP